ncbi:12845_t:CDS:1 [Acaulospora morrowiae]|uniref:12845_t:CDS:1 n=1 Tax=Acaulospora morrowiae TaxID=94023 RepID=A0A9N8V6D0_9GLOM|nr:12845_t:CDS:1 [Acaulospora morrowiae]
MVHSFPRECLEEVFHILDNDKFTLFACLQVNRFWCRSAVSFLWRHPFQLVKKPSPELIDMYISMFSQQVCRQLISEGINVPTSSPTRLFNYPSFLRAFRFDDLYESTSAWLQEGYDKGSQHKRESEVFDDLRVIKILVNELIKLFLSKSPVIYSLSLNTQRLVGLIDRRFWSHHPGDIQYTPTSFEDFRGAYGFDDLLQLPSYVGAVNCLPYLQKFEYGGDATDGKVVQALSEICKNLDTLEISFSSWQRKHADPIMMLCLLRAQHALKRIVLRRGGSNCLSILIGGLESQANSLRYLEFNGADFRGSISLKAVSCCVNLESLIFDRCLGLSDEIVEPLSTATFCRLNKFVFRKSIAFRDLRNILGPNMHPPIIPPPPAFVPAPSFSTNPPRNQSPPNIAHPLAIMIQNTRGSLEDIRMGWKVWNMRRPLNLTPHAAGDFPPPSVLSTLSIYCPRLMILEAHISRETLPHFLVLLENCFHLEQLCISVGTELMDDESFWTDMAKLLPMKLRNLLIVIEGTFWLMVLHWLLGNCRAPLKILQFPRSICIDDEYLCIITQYAKRMGTLKRLALAKRTKISSEGLRKALIVFESVTRIGEWNEDEDNLR